MTLRDAWDAQAERWARWARTPGHDSYWRFHREQFLELLPAAVEGPMLDVGCGEGRLIPLFLHLRARMPGNRETTAVV
jgi:hypothetical protein